MKIVSVVVQCQYNPNKQWTISRIGNAQYHINQLIKGKPFYAKPVRTSLKHISESVNISMKSIVNMFR